MLYLSITFDYELFFGTNHGTYEEILFDYTYRLIDALEKKGVSATFFADVCSIPVSRTYCQYSYIEGFEKQIQYMAKHRQDVQLHLHPHWFYSQWKKGQWEFSNKGYRLHEFKEEGKIHQIIFDGVQYLNDTLRSVNPQYECVAYRAGGFSMQPHEIVVKTLYENGIRVDSSVAPQLVINSQAQVYDYRHPLNKLNWYISDKAEWWEDCREGKCLYEIPVATIDKNPLSFAFKRIVKPDSVKLELGTKRGSYISVHTEPESKWKSYYKYISGYHAISMDAYTASFLYKQVKRLYRKDLGDDQVVAIIGHPKLVTDVYIDNLCRFINMITNDPHFEFITIYDAYIMEKEKWS